MDPLLEALKHFKDIAPRLTNPYVLIAFVVMLFYVGVVIGVGDSELLYSFIITLFVILVSFANPTYDRSLPADPPLDLDPIVAQLEASHRDQLDAMRSFFEQKAGVWGDHAKVALAALAKQEGPGIAEALTRSAEGDTKAAEAIFKAIEERKTAERAGANKAAAEAARHLGSLAYLHDTQTALAAYRRATVLDPDDANGWNQLGHLLRWTGDVGEAEAAYQRVLELGRVTHDKSVEAWGIGNLAILYEDLNWVALAEAMHRKALDVFEALDDKKNIAKSYDNLGFTHLNREELDLAEEMFQKALDIRVAMKDKEQIAVSYTSLGILHEVRGDLGRAEAMFQDALALFEALDSKAGAAGSYKWLGVVYEKRGELDRAEGMYLKALAIYEALDIKKAAADSYTALCVVYGKRGELDRAMGMHRKAAAIFEALRFKKGVAGTYLALRGTDEGAGI